MKEITIKDSPGFQLRVKKWECLKPNGLYAIQFIQCTKDKDGNIDGQSTYEFFMDNKEMAQLAGALVE